MCKRWIFICLTATSLGIYLGFVFHSRSRSNQAFIEKLKAPVAERDRAFLEAYGEGVKILVFHAMPSNIRRGETAQLCYGAANAPIVRIEPPPPERLWPSLSRCIRVMPQTDTRYRFIAADDHGNAKTADLTITVR
jgi:hypothetical protein